MRIRWAGAIGAFVMVSSSGVRLSHACAPPFGESNSLVNRVVPSNGVLLVEAQCFACEQFALPTSLTIKDGSDNLVSGAIVDSGAMANGYWLAFKPSAPWVPNAEYGLFAKVIPPLSGVGLPRDERLAFTGGAETSLDPGASSILATVAALTTLSGEHCCGDGVVTSCGTSPRCVFDEELTRAQLTLSVTTPVGTEGQYAYRVMWFGDGVQRGESAWVTKGVLSFQYDEPATEYCGQISARSLADGVVSELEPSCAKFAAPVELGFHPRSDAETDATLSQCQSPPESHLRRWCDLSVTCTTDECRAAQAECTEADEGMSCGVAAPQRDSTWGTSFWVLLFTLGLRRSWSSKAKPEPTRHLGCSERLRA